MPPSASSNRPFLRPARPVKAPFSWPNSSDSISDVGQRRAVHLDERLARPRRVVVDGVGDQLLARARLAADQHRRVGPRHLRHLLVHLRIGPLVPTDVAEGVALLQLLAELAVLVDQPLCSAWTSRCTLIACEIMDADEA